VKNTESGRYNALKCLAGHTKSRSNGVDNLDPFT